MPYPDLSFSEVTSAVVRQVCFLTYNWGCKRVNIKPYSRHIRSLDDTCKKFCFQQHKFKRTNLTIIKEYTC